MLKITLCQILTMKKIWGKMTHKHWRHITNYKLVLFQEPPAVSHAELSFVEQFLRSVVATFFSFYFPSQLLLIPSSQQHSLSFILPESHSEPLHLPRVFSERNVSRKYAKTFARIFKTFLRNFTFFRENKLSKNEANFLRENWKCEMRNANIPRKYFHVRILTSRLFFQCFLCLLSYYFITFWMRSIVGKDDLHSHRHDLNPHMTSLLILKNNKFCDSLNINELENWKL